MCTLYEYVRMNIKTYGMENLEMTWSYCQYRGMGWNPDLCQLGEWGGVLNCVSEDGVVPWLVSMKRIGWSHDPCQWGEWGDVLTYVNEENEVVSWTMSMRKGDGALTWISGTTHRQDIGELRKCCIVRPNESVVRTEYIMCSLTHLQKSFLNKTWLSCSLFSWRHPYLGILYHY